MNLFRSLENLDPEHYHAYLVAAKREDRAYQELADRLKRKPVEAEATTKTEKRKKA